MDLVDKNDDFLHTAQEEFTLGPEQEDSEYSDTDWNIEGSDNPDAESYGDGDSDSDCVPSESPDCSGNDSSDMELDSEFYLLDLSGGLESELALLPASDVEMIDV